MKRTMRRTAPFGIELDGDTGYEDVAQTRWFRRLFLHATEERFIDVRTPEPEDDDENEEVTDGDISGEFRTRDEDNDDPEQDPTISIYCLAGELTQAADVGATITLAHELGHHESWLRGECVDEIYSIMLDDDGEAVASLELRRAWLEEEERAWRYGREILALVIPEFPEFARFDAEWETAINGPDGYRAGLRV